jgi:hypothetical protein
MNMLRESSDKGEPQEFEPPRVEPCAASKSQKQQEASKNQDNDYSSGYVGGYD